MNPWLTLYEAELLFYVLQIHYYFFFWYYASPLFINFVQLQVHYVVVASKP